MEKTDPNKSWTRGATWAESLKLWIRLKVIFWREKRGIFLVEKCESGRGKGREKSKASFNDPWSSVDGNSSGQELKFIVSTMATRVY